MIKRIVKMHFRADEVETFKALFNEHKSAIRSQPGCIYLELLQGADDPSVFFTYSFWERKEDLQNYRHSETFATVWPRTKALFAEKPQAWSVHSSVVVDAG